MSAPSVRGGGALDDQVRELWPLLNDAPWTVGDRLVEWYGPPEMGRPEKSDSSRTFDALAARLGCETSTLSLRRTVAHRWPAERRREDVSWTVHRVLSERLDMEEAFEVIRSRPTWTVAEARAACGVPPAPSPSPRWDDPEIEDDGDEAPATLPPEPVVAAPAVPDDDPMQIVLVGERALERISDGLRWIRHSGGAEALVAAAEVAPTASFTLLIAHVNRHRLQAVGHLRQAQRIEDHVRLAGTGGAS